MEVADWRAVTPQEALNAMNSGRRESKRGSMLAFRSRLKPIDMFCYLKARFGPPNGFQELFRKDDSDNLVHWDYHLKAANQDVHIIGWGREVHVMLSEKLRTSEWPELLRRIKADFGRVGAAKKKVLHELEQWIVFPNKYIALSNICEDMHAAITEELGTFTEFRPLGRTVRAIKASTERLNTANKRREDVYGNCVKLSLLTPIVAEAFFNLIILILAKPSVRDNRRQYDAFRQSHIDVRIADLPLKCEGFTGAVDMGGDAYRNFKRVMDKRNDAIHGNIDPVRETIETVYFEGKRPLFDAAGDSIGNFLASLERLHQPEVVVKDYEDMQYFLLEVLDCIDPKQRHGVDVIIGNSFPGFNTKNSKAGLLFPDQLAQGLLQGVVFDDELDVIW
jgi:hypothetical protein